MHSLRRIGARPLLSVGKAAWRVGHIGQVGTTERIASLEWASGFSRIAKMPKQKILVFRIALGNQ